MMDPCKPFCPLTRTGSCNELCQFFDDDGACVISRFFKTNAKKETVKRRSPSKFVPPSVDEVKAYMTEKNLSGFAPESFVGYYESKGWKVGNSTMRNWQAACENWHRRRLDSCGGFAYSLDFGEYGSGL